MISQDSFFDRFDKFMSEKGLNDNQMTIICGVSNGLIGKARAKNGALSFENIAKVLFRFPDLNAGWLLTGEGEMLRSSSPPPEVATPDPTIERLLSIIESQQRTIEMLAGR